MSDTWTNVPKLRVNGRSLQPDDTAVPTFNSSESTRASAGDVTIETQGATALAPVMDIDRLWEAVPGTISQTVRALELLKEVSNILAAAQRADNPMDADRLIQRAQLALPKLFACRSVGEGFGVIVNSLHYAFVNLHGTLLRSDQLNAVWRVLRELRDRPVMSLEQGIQRVEELERHGLDVDPAGLADLLEASESADNE
jgi:hypothetical protein